MAAHSLAGWESSEHRPAHWIDTDGTKACDPTGEPRPAEGLNPWKPSGVACPECSELIAEFRVLVAHRGFELNPRYRYPAVG